MADDIELLRLRAKAKLKLKEQEETSAPEQAIDQSPTSKVETSPLEAGVRSAAQTVALNFADEAEAAIDTAAGLFKGASFGDVVSDYDKNLEASREEFARNAENHPTATNIGTGVGIAASLALPGVAALKGASLAQKAVLAAKVGTAQGAIANLGAEEDKASLKALLSTLKGGAVGGAVGAVAGVVGGKITQKLEKRLRKKEVVDKALEGLGLKTESQRKKIVEKLGKKGIDSADWMEELSQTKALRKSPKTGEIEEGGLLINNIMDGPDNISEKASTTIELLAEQRDKILLKAGDHSVPRSEVAFAIKSKIANHINAGDAANLNKLIDETVLFRAFPNAKTGNLEQELIKEPLNAFGVTAIRKALNDSTNFNSVSNPNQIKRVIGGIMNDISDDLVEKGASAEDALLNKSLRSKMSNLFSLTDALKKAKEESMFGPAALMRDAVAANLARVAGGDKGAQAAAIALRRLSVSGSGNRLTSLAPTRLADAIGNASESSIRRLAIASSSEDIMDFNREAGAFVAESSLRGNPLPRDSREAVLRKSEILDVLSRKGLESFKKAAEEAFESNDADAIGQIMSALAARPEAKGLIAPGKGWGNKLYLQEDKDREIEILKNSAIPATQRVKLIKAVQTQGVIPDASMVQPRYKVGAESPRGKKKDSY